MHKIIQGLTDSDQQIGYVNRQLVQVENELADTETEIGEIERHCTCRRGIGTCTAMAENSPATC